jgi:nitrogen fixation NifU-like protein
MTLDLRELYQEVILDHHKHPRNRRAMPESSASADGHNPLCGDNVTVYIKTAGSVVEEVSFEGSGCAISTASASMMTEALQGKTLDEVEALFRQFQALVTSEGAAEPDEDLDGALGDLGVLAGVRDHPVRIKCATLPWHTMYAALKGAEEPVSTE